MADFMGVLVAIILFLIAILGLLTIYALVVYLKRQKEENVNFTDPHEKIKKEGLASCPASIKHYMVSLTGDIRHGGMVLGRIIGYTRIKRTSSLTKEQKANGMKLKKIPKERLYLNVMFYFTPKHWIFQFPPFSIFKKINNICFFDNQIANATNTLAGNVRLRGASWTNVGLLNMINDRDFDEGEAVEVMRDVAFVTLATDMVRDVAKLVKRGIDSNPAFKMAEAMKEDVVRFGDKRDR